MRKYQKISIFGIEMIISTQELWNVYHKFFHITKKTGIDTDDIFKIELLKIRDRDRRKKINRILNGSDK